MNAGVMTKFRIDELSGVDRPAQAGAKVTFIKRDFSDKQRKDLADRGLALPDGSYPIVNEEDLHNAIQAFGRAKNPAETKAHIIARAKAMGKTDALPEGWVSKEDTTMFDKSFKKSLGLAESATDEEVAKALVAKANESEMEKEKAKKEAMEMAEKAKKAEKALAKASMTPEEKAHTKDMSDGDADDFMALPADERKAKMAKSAGNDETLISGGVSIRKSDVGAPAFAFMKAQAAQIESSNAAFAKAQAEARMATFQKRAVEEFPYIAGTVEERALVLKAIDEMTDPAARTAQMTILKAANATGKFAFERVGKGLGGQKPTSEESAEAKLDKAAHEIQKANPSMGFNKAYDAALTANPALYEQYRKEKAASQNTDQN